jgi:glucose/arabinose dehydrogenase
MEEAFILHRMEIYGSLPEMEEAVVIRTIMLKIKFTSGKNAEIDINSTGPYNIPPDNPFVGVDGADEVWAYGLRNAWKFNFDTTSGNVMIADVGQGAIEEINKMPFTSRLNYGWRCYEGNNAYNTTGCAAQST